MQPTTCSIAEVNGLAYHYTGLGIWSWDVTKDGVCIASFDTGEKADAFIAAYPRSLGAPGTNVNGFALLKGEPFETGDGQLEHDPYRLEGLTSQDGISAVCPREELR